jgi:hypothetical protein
MTRKSLEEMRKAQALDGGLRGMFRALEQRPLPDRLTSVVDQLDEGEAAAPLAARRG